MFVLQIAVAGDGRGEVDSLFHDLTQLVKWP